MLHGRQCMQQLPLQGLFGWESEHVWCCKKRFWSIQTHWMIPLESSLSQLSFATFPRYWLEVLLLWDYFECDTSWGVGCLQADWLVREQVGATECGHTTECGRVLHTKGVPHKEEWDQKIKGGTWEGTWKVGRGTQVISSLFGLVPVTATGTSHTHWSQLPQSVPHARLDSSHGVATPTRPPLPLQCSVDWC